MPRKGKQISSIFPKDRIVYLVRNPLNDTYKIGVTSNLRNRIASLEHACGYRLDLVFHSSGGQFLEKKLHNLFAAKRTLSEWFSLDSSDVRAVLKEMSTAA